VQSTHASHFRSALTSKRLRNALFQRISAHTKAQLNYTTFTRKNQAFEKILYISLKQRLEFVHFDENISVF
jgi:hypothetical protein